jgi:hypothetical protein
MKASCSNTASPGGSTKRLQRKSGGQPLPELPKKLDLGEYWSFDTALFLHVSWLVSMAVKETNALWIDLANPLFSCTGMKFWLYMITVILSLPKSIVFVALGAPVSKNSKGAKWAKVVAIGVVVLVTCKFS